MNYYIAFGLRIASELDLPELSPATEHSHTDLVIKAGSIALPRISKTTIYRRGIRALFGENDQRNLFLSWEGVADFEAIEGKTLIVNPKTDDPNLLSLFTVSEALGLILFQRGYYLLHASAVKIGQEAWCFMGNPGAGKSTTAAAFVKAGCPLLSDDLTAITFDDQGVPFIIPAYPQLKIWDNTVNGLNYDKDKLNPVQEGINKFSYQPTEAFDHQPVRLNAVYFIHKANNQPALRGLPVTSIPTEMLKNFPLANQLLKGQVLAKHFTESFQIAKYAKIWKKRRPNGFKKLEGWVNETIVDLSVSAS